MDALILLFLSNCASGFPAIRPISLSVHAMIMLMHFSQNTDSIAHNVKFSNFSGFSKTSYFLRSLNWAMCPAGVSFLLLGKCSGLFSDQARKKANFIVPNFLPTQLTFPKFEQIWRFMWLHKKCIRKIHEIQKLNKVQS